MGSSAKSKLKRREEGNISVIRRADEALFAGVPEERWLFENRLLIIKLTEGAIASLEEVYSLPAERGEARIMKICRSAVEESAFTLDEEAVIAHINDYQRGGTYLTVGELLYLYAYFHFVCVDILADGIRAGTLHKAADAIKLMFTLRDLDFEHVYETVSYSESVLIRDPAGVYVRCDGATKSMYRRKLAEISRRFHMGEYETSKLILKNAEDSEGRARHVGWHILKYSRHGAAAAIYFPMLYIVPAVICGALSALAYASGRTTLFFAAILSYLPLREFIKLAAEKCFSSGEIPDILPRLSLDEIPPEGRTLLLYTVSLSGKDSDVFDRLETYAKAYKCPGLGFAVLADLPDSDTEHAPDDERLIRYAKKRIDAINRAGCEAYLFYREREKSASEGRYIGAERKRGAQAELFSQLSTGHSSLYVHGGVPSGFRYVLALDADTEILFSDIKKLIATALHPCCEPFISRSSGYPIVTDGYGVIAPVAQVSPADAEERRLYTAYRYAYGGRSEYERSSFSTYSYLFGTGSFCGKGLIHIDAYMKTVYGAFPKEKILSHDTAEGVRLRCGHASDARVYDGVPRDYLRERSRAHRWIRGDVQALCLLRRGIPSASDEKYKNPVGSVGRFIMAEPVVSAAASAIRPAAILLSLIGGTPLGLFIYLTAVSDQVLRAVSLVIGARRVPWRRYFSGMPNYYKTALFDIAFALASAADAAFVSADAQYRAFYRMRFSKKHLLEWKTAASSDRETEADAASYVRKLWPSMLAGVVAIVSVLAADLFTAFILPLYGAGWLLFPVWMHSINSIPAYPASTRHREIGKNVRDALMRDVVLMWKFFSDNVTAEYNYLPPDNVSILPEPKIAERTSPTNIGMYLLSAVNAHDLCLISASELRDRLEKTLGTLEKLEKKDGNLYNWYDIRTLAVLYPAYVSTVDSGNLTVCLMTVKNAVSGHDGFEEICDRLSKLINGVDLSVLYNKKRGLFHIGYNSVLGEYDKNVYDLYSGEILTTSFFAAARGDVPAVHFSSLGRIRVDEDGAETMLSWSGSAFEYFMPAIFLPSFPGTARYETLSAAEHAQRVDTVEIDGSVLYGRSESSFYDFDEDMNYSYKAHGCRSLAISPDIDKRDDNVFAPYSVYLLSQFDAEASDVLLPHRDGEMYGKYGFYESVDATPSRVGNDYGVARLYMAHHVGMSIASAANVLLSDINVKRFCREPFIRAALPLLYESVSINRRHSEERSKIQAKAHLPEEHDVMPGAVIADSAVISNGRFRIFAESSGDITVYDGQTLLTQPILRGCSGVSVLLRADGIIRSCTGGQRVQFSTDAASISYVNEFLCGKRIVRTELSITVSATSPEACFELTVTGIDDADVLYMFSPVLNTFDAYISASSYSDLFVIAEKVNEDIVKYTKKGVPAGMRDLFFRASGLDGDDVRFHSKKDLILPFFFDEKDIESVFDADGTEINGACVHPVFAAVLKSRGRIIHKSRVMISIGEPPCGTSDKSGGREKHLRLLTTLSGADPAAVRCAMELSGNLSGRTARITELADTPDVKFARDTFWRHGISGDLPIVTVFTSDLMSSADTFAVTELICAKRFLFLSGVRFDLIFVTPAAGYMGGGAGKLKQMIKESGSERLLGKNNGIFVIDRESLSPEDEAVFITVSRKNFDIGTDHRFTLKRPGTDDSVKILSEKKRGNISFSYDKNGDAVVKNGTNASPYSMVYANAVFGTLLTNMTCGHTWYMNSALSIISQRHVDPLLGTPGEIAAIVIDHELYDLAASAVSVRWERGCAVYAGNISGVGYEMRVGVDPKLPVKLYHIKLLCEDEAVTDTVRAELIFYPSSSALYSDGRLTLMSEAAGKIYLFSASDEVVDVPENCGNHLILKNAFYNGECGFGVTAYGRDEACVRHIRDKFRRAELFMNAFDEYKARVNEILPACAYEGSETFLCGFFGYTAYQAVYVRILARSGYSQKGGAFGFRDQLQDSLAAIYFCPALTKRQILRSCARQYEDGRVQHWWHAYPFGAGLRSKCSDDYMWLPYAVSEYVLATADADILKLRIPFLCSAPLSEGEGDRYETAGQSEAHATVLEHCIAALKSSFERGSHGLPLIGSGDWNDGMNEVGIKGHGESVWLAFFFAVVYRRFSEMLGRCGIDPILAERLMYEADTLVTSAEMTSWDGKWYVRAFDDEGGVIGSEFCDECRIDLLPQAFSVFANADRARSGIAIDSVMSRLFDDRLGILRLFEPSYEKTERYGYICRYPAGIRENGGQYTHGALFFAAALFAYGDRERGKRVLSSLSPAKIYADGGMCGQYTAEPYFTAADVYFGGSITGKSGWSGYTGSAAWYYRIVIKYYFGIEIVDGSVSVTPAADAEYTTSVRVGGHSVTVSVKSADAGGPEEPDAEYVVHPGETVTFKPDRDDLKISLKVEK